MGKEQELSVLAYLIKKPDLFYQFSGQMDDLHFEYKQARILFTLLKAIFLRHQEMPSKEEFLWRVQSHNQLRALPILERMSLELRAKEIYDINVSETTGDYIAAFIINREAAKVTELLEQLQEAGHIDSAEEHLNEVQEKLDRMGRILRRDKQEGLSLPFEDEALKDIGAYVLEGYGGEPLSFGLPKLDYRTGGGARRGEHQLFLGGTGVGKTVLGVSLASNFLSQGLAVAYFAMDNSQGDLRKRFFASVTGIPVDLEQDISTWGAQVQDCAKALRNRRMLLAIQHFEALECSVRDLRQSLKLIEEGMYQRCRKRGESFNGVDVVVIDYIDLLRDERKTREKRHELQHITQACLGWASDTAYRRAIIGLSQTNVGGLTEEVATLSNMAESYSKSWAAKLIGIICQTESEYDEGLARIAFPKNTNGPKNFIIPVEINYKNYRIREREDVEGVYSIAGSRKGRAKSGREERSNPKVEERDYGPVG